MVSSYAGSLTQQLSPRQLHLSQSWPLIAPPPTSTSSRGGSCEYEVPLPYSATAQPVWDLTLEPIWKITASLKSGRQDSGSAASAANAASAPGVNPLTSPLSPLAQRAANAAVRAAAGWLSPGQWRSAQSSGTAATCHGSTVGCGGGRPRSPVRGAAQQQHMRGTASAAAQPPQASDLGLVEFQPRRWLPGGASDLESSITALADALQGCAVSQCEAFPRPADLSLHTADAAGATWSWQAAQPHSSSPFSRDAVASGAAEDWGDDGEDSVDGELGHSGEGFPQAASLQLHRSSSSDDFFSACSGSLSVPEDRSHPGEPCSASQLPPLAAVPANTIRQNVLGHFPKLELPEPSAPPEPAPEPAAERRAAPQVPVISPLAAAAGGRDNARGLQTPFAIACTAQPFEAPSPRDMHLSPAEERLVPAPSLGSAASSSAEGAPLEGVSPREAAERERASRMLACLWANTERAPWLQAQAEAARAAAEPRQPPPEPKRAAPHARPAALVSSCAAQHRESGGSAMGKRLFGIVGDGQSHWQPLVRESNQMMELAGLDTDWLLHDLLVFADAVYA